MRIVLLVLFFSFATAPSAWSDDDRNQTLGKQLRILSGIGPLGPSVAEVDKVALNIGMTKESTHIEAFYKLKLRNVKAPVKFGLQFTPDFDLIENEVPKGLYLEFEKYINQILTVKFDNVRSLCHVREVAGSDPLEVMCEFAFNSTISSHGQLNVAVLFNSKVSKNPGMEFNLFPFGEWPAKLGDISVHYDPGPFKGRFESETQQTNGVRYLEWTNNFLKTMGDPNLVLRKSWQTIDKIQNFQFFVMTKKPGA
jgi:hypothetical protein